MRIKIVLVAIFLAFTLKASAGELFTPTLWAVAPDGFACNLTNVGHKVRSVNVRIVSDGNVLHDSGNIALAPRHTVDRFIEGLPEGGPIYCEFTVEGSEKEYRGAAKLFHLPNSSDFAVVAAQ